MTHKFKPGDKVVLRKDLEVGKKYGNLTWLESMRYLQDKPFIVIDEISEEGSYTEDAEYWHISEEMISHKYEEQEESKYQEGDKVVIRKDLELGKEYGKDGWVERMKHLADEPYVTIEHKLSEGHYSVVNTVYRITDEMISHKYEEADLFVWYCEDAKYVHVLCCDGTVYTMSKNPDNQDKINKILEGYSDSFLLPLEEAKKSALYPALKCVEVKKPKMYYIRMGLGDYSYVNYEVEEGKYFLSSKNETEYERTKFTEEEADKIVGTNSILTKEEVE